MSNPFESMTDRRGIFGGDAANYATARPGYPDELYDILVAETGLGPGTAVLEVGAGPGQVTGRLLGLGADVTAVEIDSRMADQLIADHGGDAAEGALSVIVSAFEEVAEQADFDPEARFDLVASGTAFHWVPNAVGLELAADLLVEDGWLALWWTTYMDPDTPSDFEDAFQPMLKEIAPELLHVSGGSASGIGGPTKPYALDLETRIGEIDASGRFGPVDHRQIRWTGAHTGESLRNLFASFSPFMALEPEKGAEILDAIETLARDRFNNHVERPYITSLYLAQKEG